MMLSDENNFLLLAFIFFVLFTVFEFYYFIISFLFNLSG